jgi:hypothetical protein
MAWLDAVLNPLRDSVQDLGGAVLRGGLDSGRQALQDSVDRFLGTSDPKIATNLPARRADTPDALRTAIVADQGAKIATDGKRPGISPVVLVAGVAVVALLMAGD